MTLFSLATQPANKWKDEMIFFCLLSSFLLFLLFLKSSVLVEMINEKGGKMMMKRS